MVEPKREGAIQEETSFDLLSSPEQLDQLMRVIHPVDWLTLLTFGGLVLAAVVWGIIGRIPITVEGRGILIQPRQVIAFQAGVGGQIQDLRVKVGDCVREDQTLATMEPTGLQQQLQLAENKKMQLTNQVQDAFGLSSQRATTEQQAIAATRKTLEQRLNDTRALTPILRSKGLEAQREQRRSLEQRLKNAKALLPVLQERLKNRQDLQTQGAISQDAMLQVQLDYTKAEEAIAELETELKQLAVQSTETEQQYLDNLSQVSQLEAQLRELDNQAAQFDQESLAIKTQGDREIQDVNREIIRIQQEMAGSSEIISTQSGCITELNVSLGQVVEPGMRLGYLQVQGEDSTLKGISYLAVKDGKRVKEGMAISITPDTVQREQLGGIVGRVEKVATLPSTGEGIMTTIGNAEVAQTLLANNSAVIEIEAALVTDQTTESGYQWSSSKGTTDPITPGTTTTVRITVEERAPITFVLPFLRGLRGIK